MSGAFSGAFAKLGGTKPARRTGGKRLLNHSGSAGPRRLALILLGTTAVAGLVIVIALSGRHALILSRDAKLKPVDPLPGGLHSTPEQDALALKVNDAQAGVALRRGVSYTPPIAPSEPVLLSPSRVAQAVAAPVSHEPVFVTRPHPPAVPLPLRAAFTIPPPGGVAPKPVMPPVVIPAAGPVDPAAEQAYSKQIGDLFSQWGGREPRTDVVLPPSPQQKALGGTEAVGPPMPATAAAPAAASALPVSVRPAAIGEVLIPAGRGVYAHPILAVNSDASSPVVLQADSGPIAGDRMIGTFARQNDRLMIHVNSIEHQGETLSANGVVVAPDTMEAAVASDVDQHYLTRFILPAAAAFVAGLGQAIATTTNTATVLNPFGGAAYATHLNINQQLGVAAGAAASQIGTTLRQAAPKGPTVSLDANVAVGVMFLSNVVMHRPQ